MEIVVYNRAILLFTTDSEAVRRIHEVCCPLDDQGALERRGETRRPRSRATARYELLVSDEPGKLALQRRDDLPETAVPGDYAGEMFQIPALLREHRHTFTPDVVQ